MPRIHECFVGQARDISAEGNGVVEHDDGQIFFVPGVWAGETGRFRVTGFKKRFGFAELVELIEPSPQRTAPACGHHGFGRECCGGCPWQFMAYDAQLEAKQARVNAALSRLGFNQVEPIWPSPQILGFRNRAQLKSDGRHLGYVASGSNNLVDIHDCPILTEHNRETLAALRQTLPNPALRPRKKNQWTTVDIDETVDVSSVAINSRLPFRQANNGQNERMRAWLGDKLASQNRRLAVLELFAGSGNFTDVISRLGFSSIVAVEGVADTVSALEARNLPGVRALEANLFIGQGVEKVASAARQARILVLDPPRDGFKLAASLLQKCTNILHIAYISCDLATFSRDLSEMASCGFEVESVQPVDQFPHTPHIELLAFLSRT
jgi:23S rRNA (uracil1939-C5)-methyltransferase